MRVLLRILNNSAENVIEEENLILLTKLDNSAVAVSVEAIKYVESMPDTLIFFLNGDSIIVKEPLDTVMKKVVDLKTTILKDAQN